MTKYAIPVGASIKIIVGSEELEQLQQNLAEFQIEKHEILEEMRRADWTIPCTRERCLSHLERWIKETQYDLCYIQHCKSITDQGLTIA